jgi:hypothetical protein
MNSSIVMRKKLLYLRQVLPAFYWIFPWNASGGFELRVKNKPCDVYHQKHIFNTDKYSILNLPRRRYYKFFNVILKLVQFNLEDILLSEISQAQKDKHCMILFIYGI